MKKEIYSFFLIITTSLTFAQVGINTTNPTETLDVNGTTRVRVADVVDKTDFLLTTNDEGIIRKSNTNLFPEIKEIIPSLDIPSGEFKYFSSQNDFREFSIIINSRSKCDRSMISSFTSFRNTLLFINGIGRDKIANATVDPLGQYNSNTLWTIKFPITVNCSAETGDGGNSTQFDFSLEKEEITSNSFRYKLTNLGNITRTYNITLIEL